MNDPFIVFLISQLILVIRTSAFLQRDTAFNLLQEHIIDFSSNLQNKEFGK